MSRIIYDEIGDGYDTTRRADPEIVATLLKFIAVQPGRNYLDLACGTGNYTAELCKSGANWHGLDQSQTMLLEARQKSADVQWTQADVQATGFPDAHFTACVCTLAIHHFPDLEETFRETARILEPSGQLVVFTSTPEQMSGYWLNEYFPEMLKASRAQMPSLEDLKSAFSASGLTFCQAHPFSITPKLQDFFLYSGKQRPEIYLHERVRDGISSFRNLCSEEELDAGLARMSGDIRSGRMETVIRNFENEYGDYCFVVAKNKRNESGRSK